MKRGITKAKRKPLAVVVEPVVGISEKNRRSKMFTDGPDDEAGINMAAQMTNDELREAIKYAHDMAHNLGTAHPLFATMHGHLIQLLEIQRSRAAACSVDNSNPTGQGRADCGAYPGPGCSNSEVQK